jgi:hypothetical protein
MQDLFACCMCNRALLPSTVIITIDRVCFMQ